MGISAGLSEGAQPGLLWGGLSSHWIQNPEEYNSVLRREVIRKSTWDGKEMVLLVFGNILYQDLLNQGGKQNSRIILNILATV